MAGLYCCKHVQLPAPSMDCQHASQAIPKVRHFGDPCGGQQILLASSLQHHTTVFSSVLHGCSSVFLKLPKTNIYIFSSKWTNEFWTPRNNVKLVELEYLLGWGLGTLYK